MLDIKFIIRNQGLIKKNCSLRNVKVNLDLIKTLADKYFLLLKEIEAIRCKINKITKKIEKTKNQGLVEKAKAFKTKLKEKLQTFKKIKAELKEEWYKVPNLVHPKTPIGLDEKDNKEIKKIGKIKKFSFS